MTLAVLIAIGMILGLLRVLMEGGGIGAALAVAAGMGGLIFYFK